MATGRSNKLVGQTGEYLIAAELSRRYGREVAYCCNRKEAKDHGEKGMFLGKVPEAGDRVVLVDDVITAGTSVRETMGLFESLEGVEVVGVAGVDDRRLRVDTCAVGALRRALREESMAGRTPHGSIVPGLRRTPSRR